MHILRSWTNLTLCNVVRNGTPEEKIQNWGKFATTWSELEHYRIRKMFKLFKSRGVRIQERTYGDRNKSLVCKKAPNLDLCLSGYMEVVSFVDVFLTNFAFLLSFVYIIYSTALYEVVRLCRTEWKMTECLWVIICLRFDYPGVTLLQVYLYLRLTEKGYLPSTPPWAAVHLAQRCCNC